MRERADRERSGDPHERVVVRPQGAGTSRGGDSSREQAGSKDQREQGSKGEGSGPQEKQKESEQRQRSREGRPSGQGEQEGKDQRTKGGSDQHGESKRGDSQQGKNTGPTTAQWVVGIGSSLLVLALLGFLIYEAFSGTGSPPLVTVRVERVREAPGGYVVEVAAYNEGGATASALEIEGTLRKDTITVETSTATISYVPAETEREAGLFFTRDPRRYELEVRPLGYDRP